MSNATNAQAIATIAVDTAVELSEIAAWQAEMAQKGIETRVINEHDGPAGGWPLIEYKGPKSTLLALLEEHFDVDAAAAAELYGLS